MKKTRWEKKTEKGINMGFYTGKILEIRINAPKNTKKYLQIRMRKKLNKQLIERAEGKAIEDRRRGDIFSSSLVRDVLYSAGWSLR